MIEAVCSRDATCDLFSDWFWKFSNENDFAGLPLQMFFSCRRQEWKENSIRWFIQVEFCFECFINAELLSPAFSAPTVANNFLRLINKLSFMQCIIGSRGIGFVPWAVLNKLWNNPQLIISGVRRHEFLMTENEKHFASLVISSACFRFRFADHTILPLNSSQRVLRKGFA